MKEFENRNLINNTTRLKSEIATLANKINIIEAMGDHTSAKYYKRYKKECEKKLLEYEKIFV